MSILIKGMEMPKHCRECCFEAEGYFCWVVEATRQDTDEWLCTQYYGDTEERPDWCPLVPIPPHGRLIDADVLIERIEFEVRHYIVKDEFDKGRVAAWNNVIRAIREYVPTIIPAEEGET